MLFNVVSILFSLAVISTAPFTLANDIAERPVEFKGAGGTRIAGTLTIPAGDANARFPAILLLAGSGPTDRNGNQPPILVTDLLKQISNNLAAHGIASLRYDKRAMYANAAEMPKDRSQFNDFFRWDNFVGDAVAATKFLEDQPPVDAARVGILGHSEGAMLALEAARALAKDGRAPKVLILLSSPGRPIGAIMDDQLKNLLKKQQATPDQTRYFLSEQSRIFKTIGETGKIPNDVPPGLAALFPSYLDKFYQQELAVDPAKSAAEFPGPLLVVAGQADVQVSPESDARALETSLKTRKANDSRLLIVPNASHNLKLVKDPGAPGFTGDIAPGVLPELETWLASKLINGPLKPPAK